MARVLVIEPDTSLSETICTVLAEEGSHAVRAVATGHQAVDLLASSPEPHVVLVSDQLDGFYCASCLLELAYRRMLRGQDWVVLSAATPRTLDPRLGRWCGLMSAPIVWLPFDNDDLCGVVDAAARHFLPAHATRSTHPPHLPYPPRPTRPDPRDSVAEHD